MYFLHIFSITYMYNDLKQFIIIFFIFYLVNFFYFINFCHYLMKGLFILARASGLNLPQIFNYSEILL